jgi:hypothetical protein
MNLLHGQALLASGREAESWGIDGDAIERFSRTFHSSNAIPSIR